MLAEKGRRSTLTSCHKLQTAPSKAHGCVHTPLSLSDLVKAEKKHFSCFSVPKQSWHEGGIVITGRRSSLCCCEIAGVSIHRGLCG